MFRSVSLFFKNKSALKKPSGRFTIPFVEAKKIGVIVDDFEKSMKALDSLVKELENEGKKAPKRNKLIFVLLFQTNDYWKKFNRFKVILKP